MAMADGSSTSMADFVSDPAGLCTTFQVDNDEEQVHYHFTVQDTPGDLAEAFSTITKKSYSSSAV